ncbi:hypothetical protein VNI00_014767 [Paramarasmius palmivorus]|uniref:Lectin n=1 Tax=Paramarasmius palmivorus TaxID=297713 RepID=A0AAW0BRU7_9AGAR
MSKSQEVILIVDVDNTSATFSRTNDQHNVWQDLEAPIWYGGSAAFVNTSPQAYFNMSFHGTSISFYGSTVGLNSEVELDQDDKVVVQTANLGSQALYWYQSPVLADQEHEISAWVDHAYVDYALIEAGSTTNLSGKTIFVDDANEDELWYTGEWTMDPDSMYPNQLPNSSGSPPFYILPRKPYCSLQ